MKLRSLFVAGVLVFAAGGCSKKVSIEDLKNLKTEACACRDKACAKKVQTKLEDTLGDATQDDVGKEGMELSMDIAMCIAKAEAGFYDLGK